MLIDKVDLVMWTMNGAETLPFVLKQIERVIPEESVNERIIVDDQSTDNTREIAKSSGWRVFFNEGRGISSGANTALKHVASEFFISFEQDLLLAREWWAKIPRLLADEKMAVASGVRLPYKPVALRKLHEYTLERYQKSEGERMDVLHSRTMDNTIYRTKIIRRLGGFPSISVSAGVDTFLAKKIISEGFRWEVDYSVRSIHLRGGLKDELAHHYWYGVCHNKLAPVLFDRPVALRRNILRFLFSPISGLQIALRKKAPAVAYIYPLIRLNSLRGMLQRNRLT